MENKISTEVGCAIGIFIFMLILIISIAVFYEPNPIVAYNNTVVEKYIPVNVTPTVINNNVYQLSVNDINVSYDYSKCVLLDTSTEGKILVCPKN